MPVSYPLTYNYPLPYHRSLLIFALSTCLLTTSCGSGGNAGGDIPVNVNADPDINTESGNGNGNGPNVVPVSDSIPSVALDSPVTGQVDANRHAIYKVPPGSEVLLTRLAGNPDLYLYSKPEASSENLLCRSTKYFAEDICTTNASEISTYARVVGRTAASYRLTTTNDCSVRAINRWVDRSMRDYYLFSDQVPTVNLQAYDDPQALLNDLRQRDLDPYSTVKDAAAQASFYDEGFAFGLGYRWARDNDSVARFARIDSESPMGLAGIERSDIVVSVNGVLWGELGSAEFQQFVGTRENPRPATWTYIDSDSGETKSVELVMTKYKVNSVSHYSLINNPDYDGSIGYLAFETFLNTSANELDTAISFFSESGITDLILDMRYNGGGRTHIARKLASQIAGPATDGKLLIEYRLNRKYESLNTRTNFAHEPINLQLDRLIVLTTDQTASAAEIVINSLRPYIEVITIGSTTRGKPYTSSAFTYCGKSLNAMTAIGVNARGVDVSRGIRADCHGSDDLTRDRDFDSERGLEGFTRDAAEYLAFGTCETPSASKLKRTAQSNPLDKQELKFSDVDGD